MNSEIIREGFLPHYLSELTNENNGIRFIHFSTDCVFSGLKEDIWKVMLQMQVYIWRQ